MDLLKKYRGDDFEPAGNELPDHVPLFLEFLGALIVDGQEERAEQLLGEAIDVLAAIGYRLERNASPYAAAFTVMRTLTDTQPEPQRDPAVRDIDEGGKRSAPTPAVSSHC
jgi:nitrate reductase delta subunit